MSRPGTEISWEQGRADVLKQIKMHLRGFPSLPRGRSGARRSPGHGAG